MDIVKKLRAIDEASRRADGTPIPLGQQCAEAADEIERLERLLVGRDIFIVENGLWEKFVATLPQSK